MGKAIRNGESGQVKVKGKTIIGWRMNVYNIASANNTEPTTPDLMQVNVNATYRKNSGSSGKAITLMQGPVLPIALHSCILNPRFAQLHPLVDANINIATAGAGNPGAKAKVFDLYLGGPLTCKADEEVMFEVRMGPSVFSGNSSTSNSYVEFAPIHSEEIGAAIPIVVVQSIQGSEASQNYPLGDNVTFATVINLDKENSDQVISSLAIESKNYSESFDFYDLANLTLSKFVRSLYGSNSLTDVILNCICLIDNRELDEANLNISFNQSNVVSGKNFIVSSQYITDTGRIVDQQIAVKRLELEKIQSFPKTATPSQVKLLQQLTNAE